MIADSLPHSDLSVNLFKSHTFLWEFKTQLNGNDVENENLADLLTDFHISIAILKQSVSHSDSAYG